MNKRKVLSILLLALITVTLAVSCSSNIDTPAANTEELAYVTFGNSHSRELNTSYQTEPYNLLYWFYTAQKTDSYGTTGQVGLGPDGKPTEAVSKNGEDPAQGLSGRVGPFSQGAWKFKLYAYGYTKTGEGTTAIYTIDRNKLVYESEEVSVTLKGGDVKNVPVSVSTQGGYGTIQVNNAYFEWKKDDSGSPNGGITPPSIKFSLINSQGQDIATEMDPALSFTYDQTNKRFNLPNNTYSNIPVGYYTGIVSVYLKQDATTENGNIAIDNEGTPVYKQSFGVRIYGNATTYISGNMVEGVDSKVTFDVAEQDMKVFVPNEDGSAEIKCISVTPSGESGKTTSVVFNEGALSGIQDNATLQLDVKVTPVESANEKFNITGTTDSYKSAFAGIDISLMQTTSNGQSVAVDSFNNNSNTTATVTTYIAKGLSNVEVKYSGNPNENITSSYNPNDGCLSFTTYHFSEYYVLADCEATNLNRNIGYKTLADALKAAVAGDTIALVKDINVSEQINLATGVTIDGKNHTIKASDNATWSTVNGSKMLLQISSDATVRNVILDSNKKACGVQVYAATGVKLENVTLMNSNNAGLLINASQVVVSGRLTMSGNSWGNYINLGWGSNVQHAPEECTLDLLNATLVGIDNIWTDTADLSHAGVTQDTWGNRFAVKSDWAPLNYNYGIVVVPAGVTKYTVTFNTDGGSEIASVEVLGGQKVSKPADPVKEGFKFIKWQLDDEPFTFENAVTKDITLKATWMKIEYVNTLSEINNADFSYNSSLTTKSDPIEIGAQNTYYIVREWQDLWFGGDVKIKNVEFAKGVSFYAQGPAKRTLIIEDCIIKYCDQKNDILLKYEANNNFRIDNSGNGLCLSIDGNSNTPDLIKVEVKNCSFIGDNNKEGERKDSFSTNAFYEQYKTNPSGFANYKGRGNGIGIGTASGKGRFLNSVLIDGCTFEGLRNAAVQLYTFDCPITISNCDFKSWGINKQDISGEYKTYAIRGDVPRDSHENASLTILNCTFDSNKLDAKFNIDNLERIVE